MPLILRVIYRIKTVNTQQMQRPDVLVQLDYIWLHIQAVNRPSSGQHIYSPGQERLDLYLYSLYGPYALYRTSVPVQYSYTSTPLSTCTVQVYLYSPQYLYSTAIPLLPSVPVQYSYTSTPLSACTTVHFTLLLLLCILTRFITQFSSAHLHKGSSYYCLPNTSNTSIRKILCSTDFLYACINGDITTNPSQISAEIPSNLTE